MDEHIHDWSDFGRTSATVGSEDIAPDGTRNHITQQLCYRNGAWFWKVCVCHNNFRLRACDWLVEVHCGDYCEREVFNWNPQRHVARVPSSRFNLCERLSRDCAAFHYSKWFFQAQIVVWWHVNGDFQDRQPVCPSTIQRPKVSARFWFSCHN